MKKGEKKMLTKREKELIVKVVETLLELNGFKQEYREPQMVDMRTGKTYTPTDTEFYGYNKSDLF